MSKPDITITTKHYPDIHSRIVKDKVVLDLQPTCKGPALMYDLTIHKDGEWWCEYAGFLDLDQLAMIESVYTIKVNKVTTLTEIEKINARKPGE